MLKWKIYSWFVSSILPAQSNKIHPSSTPAQLCPWMMYLDFCSRYCLVSCVEKVVTSSAPLMPELDIPEIIEVISIWVVCSAFRITEWKQKTFWVDKMFRHVKDNVKHNCSNWFCSRKEKCESLFPFQYNKLISCVYPDFLFICSPAVKQEKIGCLWVPPICVTAGACVEALCNGTPANGDAVWQPISSGLPHT